MRPIRASAIHALKMKTIDVLPLISRTFPLSEGVEAFNSRLRERHSESFLER